jgi:hypothetical protein
MAVMNGIFADGKLRILEVVALHAHDLLMIDGDCLYPPVKSVPLAEVKREDLKIVPCPDNLPPPAE